VYICLLAAYFFNDLAQVW